MVFGTDLDMHCQASVMLGEAKVHLDNAIGALGQAMRK
jgi:hypothetical protein